jgi:hypothetical protein
MDIKINQMDYEHLEPEAIAKRLLAVTALSSSDADLLASNQAGRKKAVEILKAHDRTQQRQDRISRNREILRASVLG